VVAGHGLLRSLAMRFLLLMIATWR